MNVYPRSFCSLLLLVMLTFPLSLNAELWDSGPTAPFAPTQIYSGGDGQILLARASFSSVWLSRDGGYYWQCLDLDIYEVNNTSYYSIRPYMVNDSTYVFFCDSDEPEFSGPKVIVSFDYGESFTDRSPSSWPSNVNENSFTVHLEFDDHWMVQTDDNVYFTEDAGESWLETSSIPDDNYSKSMNGFYRDPLNTGIYFYSTNYLDFDADPSQHFTQIFRTSQDPRSWTFDTPFIDTSVDLESMSITLAEILPLTNGGLLTTAWSYPNDPSWDEDHLVTFDEDGNYIARSGGNLKFEKLYLEDSYISGRIYAKVVNCQDIYVSTDYGITWSVLATNGLPEIEPFHLISFSQATALHTLYISIKDVGIYKSDDHGANWELMETFDWSRFCDLYPYAEDLFYSNGDTKWYRQAEPGSEILPLGISHPDSIYMHGQVYYANGDTLLGPVSVYPMNDYNQYRLYKTVDNGQNWEIIADLMTQDIEPFYDLRNNRLNLFSMSDDGYTISWDLGDTWTSVPNPQDEFGGVYNELLSHNGQHIYCGNRQELGSNLKIYELNLQTGEWTDTNYPDTLYSSTPSLLTVPYGVAAFCSDRYFYRYNRYQELWEAGGQIPDGVKIPSHSKYFYNDPMFVIGYNDLGSEIIFTRDDGHRWDILELYVPGGAAIGQINGFEQDFNRNRIWIETNLGLFWYSMEDFLDAEEGKLELNPADFYLFTAYPNPFNASTRIQYNLVQPGNVKLDVFNINGRLVKTLQNGYQPVGIQSVFFDGSGLASGTYLLRLDAGVEVKNRRITLIK